MWCNVYKWIFSVISLEANRSTVLTTWFQVLDIYLQSLYLSGCWNQECAEGVGPDHAGAALLCICYSLFGSNWNKYITISKDCMHSLLQRSFPSLMVLQSSLIYISYEPVKPFIICPRLAQSSFHFQYTYQFFNIWNLRLIYWF